MIRRLRAAGRALLVAATTLSLPGLAYAQTITIEVLHAWPSHKRFHEPIAEAFMKAKPDVKVLFRAPAASYADGHQRILREAVTGTAPDIYYSGYNALPELARTLNERGQIADLGPLLANEGQDFTSANYAPNVLALGQVGGRQWGMPFNASTPIMYLNKDLVTRAGGSPDAFPTDWKGVIELAKKIRALGGVDGLAYEVSEWGDDWLWQALVYNHGGSMMDAAGQKVTFGDEAGLKAVTLIRRFVSETGMPILNEDQAVQQFAAGKLGIFIGSTAEVRVMGDAIGGKFEFATAPYPVADTTGGGLPTGGNAAVILASDPDKQKAAWEFIKFATGPEGQRIVVLGSGYMPANLKTAQSEFLGDFYAKNPNWTTSMKQWPIAKAWFGYPGNRGTKIWNEQRTVLAKIMRGESLPDAGLAELVAVTERLLEE